MSSSADKLIQQVLDSIDQKITGKLNPQEIADEFGYSVFHFNRIFSKATGTTLMAYVTYRKLRFALYDISCGKRILDVALKYGFETHAGFTKAFKKHFGYPPSFYRIHAIISRPVRMEVSEIQRIQQGETIMYPTIMKLQPFTVAGFTSRHHIPDVRFTHDIPFYAESINYRDPLIRLHNTFTKSRHTEYAVCFNIDEAAGEFSYLLAVGVDTPEDRTKIEPDMHEMTLPGGWYARFTTPFVEDEKHARAIKDLWKLALDTWLPASEYEFDESRYDFEYYDERDHFYKDRGVSQMDIFIPVKKKQL